MPRKYYDYCKAGGPPADWEDLHISVDGEECRHVIEASVGEGWARTYLLTEEGDLRVNPITGRIRETTRRGEIKIWKD